MTPATAHKGVAVVGLVFALSCQAKVPTNVANTIQPGRALAGVEIGTPESALDNLLGKPNLSSGQSRHYPDRHLTIFIVEDKVATILMAKPCTGSDPFAGTLAQAHQVRTARSVGCDSTLDEVRAEFGEPERQRSVESALLLAYPKAGVEFQVGETGVCSVTVRPATEG
jgi:hypothetical protein